MVARLDHEVGTLGAMTRKPSAVGTAVGSRVAPAPQHAGMSDRHLNAARSAAQLEGKQ